jgi:hypothetical protein
MKCLGSDLKKKNKHENKTGKNALLYRLITLLITSQVREIHAASKLEEGMKMYDYDTFELWFADEKGM